MKTNCPKGQTVLWIIPERLGDALMGTAALAFLKTMRPDLTVNLCAFSNVSLEVYENNPHIAARYRPPDSAALTKLAQTHDVLLHTHPDLDPAWQNACQGRIQAPPSPALQQHQAQVQLNFIAHWLDIPAPAPDTCHYELYVDDILTEANQWLPDDNLIYIGCAVGCNRLAKRGLKFWKPMHHSKVWPIESFLSLADLAAQQAPNWRFVLLGAKGERPITRPFMRKYPQTINLVGNTTIRQMAAIMTRINALVVCDSGILHVGCAQQRPLLSLHGPTDPRRTGPYPPAAFRHVLKQDDITHHKPETVFTALTRLLAPS